jgi:hypothetical protein
LHTITTTTTTTTMTDTVGEHMVLLLTPLLLCFCGC